MQNISYIKISFYNIRIKQKGIIKTKRQKIEYKNLITRNIHPKQELRVNHIPQDFS